MSSTGIEKRLTELEGRYAFLDDLVNQLDGVIVGQQRRIEELQAQLKHLHQLLDRAQAGESASGDERPPHY